VNHSSHIGFFNVCMSARDDLSGQTEWGGGKSVKPSQADFDAASLGVFLELQRRRMGEVEGEIVRWLMQQTFLRRRTRAYVRKQKYFCQGSKSKTHVSEGLARLMAAHVIIESPPRCYTLNVNFLDWNFPLRPESERLGDQQPELELDPNLRHLLTDVFVETRGGQCFNLTEFPAVKGSDNSLAREDLPRHDTQDPEVIRSEQTIRSLDANPGLESGASFWDSAGSTPGVTTGPAGGGLYSSHPPGGRDDSRAAGEVQEKVPEKGTFDRQKVPDSGGKFPKKELLAKSGTFSESISPHTPLFKGEVSKLKALNAGAREDAQFDAETQFMGRLQGCLPADVVLNDGGKWRKRFRVKRGKTLRVVAAMEEELKQPGRVRPIVRPGGFIEDLWQRFAD
jgi:hypothetical protein